MTTIEYAAAEELLDSIGRFIVATHTVLDVGCGIRPQEYFTPKLHLMLEPFDEYVDILRYKFDGQPTRVVLQGGFDDVMPFFADKSVDTVFLLDLIEHLEKEDGKALLYQAERIARRQVVVFTPLGFMPQEYEAGEVDGWGLGGTELQEHRSGWLPDEFEGQWSFHVCQQFHLFDAKGNAIDDPFGAFFAILDMTPDAVPKPKKLSSIPSLNTAPQVEAEKTSWLRKLLKRDVGK